MEPQEIENHSLEKARIDANEQARDDLREIYGEEEDDLGPNASNTLLSDKECSHFRSMNCSFNDMLRACFAAGMAKERQECWDAIDKCIKRGPLPGNGRDEHAQRNGLVLASNIIMERICNV